MKQTNFIYKKKNLGSCKSRRFQKSDPRLILFTKTLIRFFLSFTLFVSFKSHPPQIVGGGPQIFHHTFYCWNIEIYPPHNLGGVGLKWHKKGKAFSYTHFFSHSLNHSLGSMQSQFLETCHSLFISGWNEKNPGKSNNLQNFIKRNFSSLKTLSSFNSLKFILMFSDQYWIGFIIITTWLIKNSSFSVSNCSLCNVF